jgi:hypothetical protein
MRILSLFLLILLTRCQVVSPLASPETQPALSRAAVPDSLRLGDAAGMRISVRAGSRENSDAVERVLFYVFAERNPIPVFQDTLRDDGREGDILPLDGEYTGWISGPDLGGRAGTYRIGFLAVPPGGTAGDTLFSGFRAVEGTSNSAPVIVRLDVPDSLSQEELHSVRFSVRAEDPDGTDDIDSVLCDVYPPFQPEPVFRLAMTRIPMSPPPTGLAGGFEFTGDLSGFVTISGTYAFRFQARESAGLLSLPRVAHVVITLPNQPPVLSELTAPDTVSRRSSDAILLSVRATDPQGPADIKRVYFNSFKPDGTPGSGNPFSMFDDGTNGDVTAGDGVYSRGIMISASNALGNYRFYFYAEDLAGEAGGTLTHVITVTDQIPD